MIIGGARSGKSRFAQRLASELGEPVLFVATAEAGDEEMKRRIEQHKRERPADWSLLEVTSHVGSRIGKKLGEAQVVVVDCITLMVSNILSQYIDLDSEQIDAQFIEEKVIAETNELVECISQVDASFVIVTNEVGLGLVPDNKAGRLYRDLLGRANQILAQCASEVYMMVAGLPVRIQSDSPS